MKQTKTKQNSVLLLPSSIAGTPIKDDTCVTCDPLFTSLATWAATFHLQGFHPMCAVFLCDHTTSREAFSFTTDEYETFNVRTHLDACHTHEGGSGTNKSGVFGLEVQHANH